MKEFIIAYCSTCKQPLEFDTHTGNYFCKTCKINFQAEIGPTGFQIEKIISPESFEQLRIELKLPPNISPDSLENKITQLRAEIIEIEDPMENNYDEIKKIKNKQDLDLDNYTAIFYTITALSIIAVGSTSYFEALNFINKIVFLIVINIVLFLLIIVILIIRRLSGLNKISLLREKNKRIHALVLSRYERLGKLLDMLSKSSQNSID
jgi:hypothetical protein